MRILTAPPGRQNITGDLVAKSDLIFNVRDYGAVADGVTNDAAAVQSAVAAALALARGGATIFFPPGEYAINTAVTGGTGIVFAGAGKYSTRIVQGGAATNTSIFVFNGVVTDIGSPSADVVKGQPSLTVTSGGSNLVAGDWIILRDTFSNSVTDANYKSAEPLFVESMSGNSITLTHRVKGSWSNATGSYTTANGAIISKVAPLVGVGVRDMSIQMRTDVANTQILFSACDRVSVTDVHIREGGAIGLRVHTSRNVTISNLTAENLTDNIGGGQAGYGVAASGACYGITLANSVFKNVRHAFTTMGGAHGGPWNVAVIGCIGTEIDTAVFDTHAAGSDITFTECIAADSNVGFTVRSRRTTVQSCTISRMSGPGIQTAEENVLQTSLINNVITDCSVGIWVPDTAGSGITIQGNLISHVNQQGIAVSASWSRVRIVNNTVIDCSMTQANAAIHARVTAGTVASGSTWVVANNTIGQTGASAATGSNPIATTGAGSSNMAGAMVVNNNWFGTWSFGLNVTTTSSRNNYKIDTAPTTVSGSKGSNAALTSLCAALAAQGLITNSTS